MRSFGHDPEVPAGFQDADLEQRELEAEGDRLAREKGRSLKALLIPVEGPLQEIELQRDDEGSSLVQLQELVGGHIEAVPLPAFIRGAEVATAYIHHEGKFEYPGEEGFNRRATDFLVPGVGLFWGDHIAGPFVLCGFNPETGENADVPEPVVRRARLIEREAG